MLRTIKNKIFNPERMLLLDTIQQLDSENKLLLASITEQERNYLADLKSIRLQLEKVNSDLKASLLMTEQYKLLNAKLSEQFVSSRGVK